MRPLFTAECYKYGAPTGSILIDTPVPRRISDKKFAFTVTCHDVPGAERQKIERHITSSKLKDAVQKSLKTLPEVDSASVTSELKTPRTKSKLCAHWPEATSLLPVDQKEAV